MIGPPVSDFVDGDDCDAGESDAAAAASDARFAWMALAASLGSEKSPKSESESLSLNFLVAAGFAIGFAVADFLGTALGTSFLPEDFFESLADFLGLCSESVVEAAEEALLLLVRAPVFFWLPDFCDFLEDFFGDSASDVAALDEADEPRRLDLREV